MDVVRKTLKFGMVWGIIPSLIEDCLRAIHPLMAVTLYSDRACVDDEILSHFQESVVAEIDADAQVAEVRPQAFLEHVVRQNDWACRQANVCLGEMGVRIHYSAPLSQPRYCWVDASIS